jgi:hypothetical protein
MRIDDYKALAIAAVAEWVTRAASRIVMTEQAAGKASPP